LRHRLNVYAPPLHEVQRANRRFVARLTRGSGMQLVASAPLRLPRRAARGTPPRTARRAVPRPDHRDP